MLELTFNAFRRITLLIWRYKAYILPFTFLFDLLHSLRAHSSLQVMPKCQACDNYWEFGFTIKGIVKIWEEGKQTARKQ